MENRRRAVRTPFKSRIRISHESFGSIETYTRDISDTGVFLSLDGEFYLDLGSVISAQVVGLPGGEAPELKMEVVRVEGDGAGLKFI